MSILRYLFGMRTKSRIEDVALAAGVSTATVSRVISQPDRVSQTTRDKVLKVIEQLSYVPDAAGRALASGRTMAVGCVIPTLDLAIFARSTHAMQLTLAKSGYQLLVASHNYDLSAEINLVRALQSRGVDALVLVGAEHHAQTWSSLKNWNKPVLLTWVCSERLPSVGFDNPAIAGMATRHLLELGHRKIGMISGHVAQNDRATQRMEGFLQAMADAGISSADCVSQQELNISGGRSGLRQLLALPDQPTALLCGNDMIAIGALLEAQSLGLRVPQDLSICGIDNHELGGEIKPGLTTISLPTKELGSIAATQILHMLAGEPVPQKSLLPFELVRRGSTAQLKTQL